MHNRKLPRLGLFPMKGLCPPAFSRIFVFVTDQRTDERESLHYAVSKDFCAQIESAPGLKDEV